MQPTPPPQPQPEPGIGWSRFWLGVLAGGCGVMVLEALAAILVLFVVGAAVGSVVRQAGGDLPIGIPTGLPGAATRSDPCSPQPCVARGGVTVLVAGVDRNAGPASDGRAHLVRLQLTFVDGSGTHTVTPEEVALRDPSGAMLLPGMDAASAGCGDTSVSADLQAGQQAGPYTVCYAVGGPAAAPLTLVWVDPEDLSLIELKLP